MRARAAALAAILAAASATPAPAAPPYHPPRTAASQPDLQGVWTNVTVTRLEREPGLPLTLPPADEAAFEARAVQRFMHPPDDDLDQRGSEWQPEYRAARLGGRLRTSFIVEPADGRLPFRPGGRERLKALSAKAQEQADDPEARTPGDRCLMGGGNPPMMNPNSAGGRQIVQTPGAVVILAESNHDARIVRLIPAPAPDAPRAARHLPAAMRLWMGDSVGWWAGDTLVVETTNLRAEEGWHGLFLLSPDAVVTERFTRTGPDALTYAFAVDDPATYVQAWRGEEPFTRERGPLYEYACHEGNYSMAGMLTGARKPAAGAAATPP